MVAKLQIVPEGISLSFFLEQTYIPFNSILSQKNS